MELQLKHRPKVFKNLFGQEGVKKPLLDLVKKRRVPHALLFSGPSGTGKTTSARIVVSKFQVGSLDFVELNAAVTRGIDDIRDRIERRANYAVRKGGSRFFILDEAHKLTNDAQNALLKILEEPPPHIYFILCTTHPGKLIPTIRNRCTRFEFELLVDSEMEALVRTIAEKEKMDVSDEVVDRIIKVAQGSPRTALTNLNKILTIEDEDDRLDAIRSSDAEKQAFQLCQKLLDPRTKWKEVGNLLKVLEEPEEGIRHLMLAYANKVCLSGGPKAVKAYQIIQCFRDPYYECGRAGLTASCYEVMSSKS